MGEEEKDVPEAEAKEQEVEEKDDSGPRGKEETEAAEPERELEKPKEPEKPKELEVDATDESRPTVSPGTVEVSSTDATLNVMPTSGGSFLMALVEGGFQYLLAGARATVGIKAGRYMFEIKILESIKHSEQRQDHQTRAPNPRNLVRIGLSRAGSSLLLGDGSSDNVSFDSEGFFVHERSRKKVGQKFKQEATVCMLINLVEGSPNANTISLFQNGVRITEPQQIPEKMRGKPLYPTITYKNVTLRVNFGPTPMTPLPFRCHMLSEVAQADAEVVSAPEQGRNVVLFPVGLPSQGYFDWVDKFVASHPEYMELSDRKILDWATKSGLWRQKGSSNSLDKPDAKFGLQTMDDNSIRRLLSLVAPTAKRNFIVPELKANLLAEDRKQALQKFPPHEFKRIAIVVAGEPDAEFKEHTLKTILAEKKSKAEAEIKKKRAEEERKRLVEEKKKKAEEARKRVEEARKRKREGKEVEDEEAKDEDAEEKAEETKEDAKDEPIEVEVELTEEEKALWYRKMATPDVTEQVLSKSYADFSFPNADEGFDEITFEWQSEADAAKLIKDWIFAKKLIQRVEDILPGSWFKEEWPKWTKTLQDWRKKQSEWKDPHKRKAMLAARAEAKKKEAEEKGEEAPAEPMEIDVDELDVMSVEDVLDIGNGEPLFANFAYEDWALLSIRFEMHLLLHAFRKDLDDPDRPSFAEKDLAFYYNRYFKKAWNLKNFGVEKLEGLLEYIRDTVKFKDNDTLLQSLLADDTPTSNFLKLTEEHRRERQRRVDAGDETADIKFPRNATPPSKPPAGPPPQRGAVGGRPPPHQPRYGSAAGGSSQSRYGSSSGGSHHAAYAGSSQKRGAPSSTSYSSKQPRTSSYSSGSYYRR